jgi:superfamily II DNA or RNA helicase
MGSVRSDPEKIAGEYWYRVKFANRTDDIPEDELDPVSDEEQTIQSLAEAGNWGQLDAVRCALAVERLQHTNRSTIYAFQNQRILFQPYQYKPLLKVLDSPDRRLLIADEVGLGKTIEAGLILTELNARKPLDSVMIVCPSRLREKWRNELNRKFNEEFEIYDRQAFEQAAQSFLERPGRVRIRGIMSFQAMRNPKVREVLTAELGSLDMVIFDEAHHARNTSTSTSGLLRDLCEVSDSVILLTATPIHLGHDDLFTLLNALRPGEFRESWTFGNLLQRHSLVHVASGLTRTQKSSNLPQIREILSEVFIDGRSEDSIDPLAQQLVDELTEIPPIERRDWINIERRIQDLHPLGTVLTRTVKRSVLADAPIREAMAHYCDWTSEEDEAYQRLIEASGSSGWPSSRLSFEQVQRARQAASCLPAAYEKHIIGKDDDDSTELTDILPSELKGIVTEESGLTSVLDGWSGEDSKYKRFREILTHVFSLEPDTKVLVFTFFKGTARYLERRLAEAGIAALRIDGDVLSDPRKPETDERGKRLLQFREDPGIRVMVSTEVGSEGLDFQFCHHLVNYDLPWNPMVVEQRIGRIDRFGQKEKKIFIHNLIVRGTVEDRILERLYKRIRIFENSIGSLEAIIGDTVRSLQREFLSGALSPEQAEILVEQAANAIEQRQTHLQQLEQQASQLFGHEEYVLEQLQQVRNLGQFVSEKSIIAILRTYFRSFHPSVRIQADGESVYRIRLSDGLRSDIQDAARKLRTVWIFQSKDNVLPFTTSGETAFENPRIELINASHPLLRAAIDKLLLQMESPTARLGSAAITIGIEDAALFPAGDYFLMLAPQQVYGIRKRRLIETIGISVAREQLLSSEHAQRLLYLAIENGEDWEASECPTMHASIWERMRHELIRRTAALKVQEKGENDALFIRRRNALIAEYTHDLQIKTKRLKTSERKGNERATKLFQAQIDKAESKHREELADLEKGQAVGITPGDAIAACVVRVKHLKATK